MAKAKPLKAAGSPSASGLGGFIRNQRRISALSLRQLAELSSVSNAYLSQIERGLHEPSLRVVRAIAGALDITPDALLSHAGLAGGDSADNPEPRLGMFDVETAIGADEHLAAADKEILLDLYRRLRGDTTSA